MIGQAYLRYVKSQASYSNYKANVRKRGHTNMAEFKTVFVSGEIFWCKAVGKPVANYEGTGREWTLDFVPDDVTFLKEFGLLDRLKDPKEPATGPFLRLKKPELDSEGARNEPIEIVTKDGEPWDGSLIGNGSKADLKLTIAIWGKGKKSSIWTKAIRVTDHVEYKTNAFAGMDNGTASASPASTEKAKPSKSEKAKAFAELDEDLSDEIPF